MNSTVHQGRRSKPAAQIVIRDASEDDLPAIVNIYNAAIATRLSTARLEQLALENATDWLREQTRDGFPFWVAELDGHIAGWLSIKNFLPRSAYRGTVELSVYVDEQVRRRGVAGRLIGEAVTRGQALGIRAMVGLIFANNDPSLRLFEKFGFERWGYLPGVARLDGVTRDLTLMGRAV